MKFFIRLYLIFILFMGFSRGFLWATDINSLETTQDQSHKFKSSKSKTSKKRHSKSKKIKAGKSKDETNLNAQDEVSDQNEVSQQADSKSTKHK